MKAIFLIDDDADDREIFQMALQTFDEAFTYAEAENGEDALNKLGAADFVMPDIIFLDLNMPKIDGRQFLKEIKQMDAFKNIPVIIYTTTSGESEKELALRNGAAGFMTKHHSLAELCAGLKSLL